jgi:tRNA-specific 2-thiouridylase
MIQKKVFVAMSGGVDSSVAAYLLMQEGYDVTGIYMRLHENDSGDAERDFLEVCESLGIEGKVVDLIKPFRENVIEYFKDAYAQGLTPNPCVVCNKHIKFGALLDIAVDQGADFIATGHYAQIELYQDVYRIKKAKSVNKDQTYMFYNMNQNVLSKVLMPLGKMDDKTVVRNIAEKIGLDVAHKKDSQEICFIPDDNYIEFLRQEGIESQEGPFLNESGEIIGNHKGIFNYTIGQRKGLGITFGKPTYVVGIDAQNHAVQLGDNDKLFATLLEAKEFNLVSDQLEKDKIYTAKIRYSSKPSACTIESLDAKRIIVRFDTPQRAITPGQSIVFYDGDYLLGGAIISKKLK